MQIARARCFVLAVAGQIGPDRVPLTIEVTSNPVGGPVKIPWGTVLQGGKCVVPPVRTPPSRVFVEEGKKIALSPIPLPRSPV